MPTLSFSDHFLSILASLRLKSRVDYFSSKTDNSKSGIERTALLLIGNVDFHGAIENALLFAGASDVCHLKMADLRLPKALHLVVDHHLAARFPKHTAHHDRSIIVRL